MTRGWDDQGTKWRGTKWPGDKMTGTKWPGTKWKGTKRRVTVKICNLCEATIFSKMSDNSNWREHVKYVMPTTDKEFDTVVDCIMEHYVPHEPMCQAIGLLPPGYRWGEERHCQMNWISSCGIELLLPFKHKNALLVFEILLSKYIKCLYMWDNDTFSHNFLSLRIPFFDQLVRNDVKQGLTYMAYDTRNNELMGVAIGTICKSKTMMQCVLKLVWPMCSNQLASFWKYDH
jgi:hypothetical protein